MEFGVRLPAGGPLASVPAMARVAQGAEELGFDAVWVHDFLVWTKVQEQLHVSCGSVEIVNVDDPPLFYESLTNLAWLAGITHRVKLGVAILCVPYREPIATAKQIANIDLLSEGRLILGVGPGGAREGHNQDFEVLRIPRREKWDRMREHLQVMEAIWIQEKPSFDGRWSSFEPTDINPKPLQKPFPPLWGCGRMDRTLELTAELCTGWIPSWVLPSEYPVLSERLRQMAGGHGREGVDWVIADEIHGCIAPTHEEAVNLGRSTLEVFTRGFGSNPEQERIWNSSYIGDPDEVGERIGLFVDGGVTHFELKFIYHTVDGLLNQMQLFADRVIPSFR
ncbi:MAG: LLM class flavin-dependent oxidoreductase [Candidatus Dormibacteraceae bacterium]